jgi:hypothetical protein
MRADEATLHAICREAATPASRVERVQGLSSADDLIRLLEVYNWDDGYDVPTAIALHPAADLAVALKLYWLANADQWHGNDDLPSPYYLPDRTFGRLISERILSGCYAAGTASWEPGFTGLDLLHFRNRNLPEVFYTPVAGKPTTP